MNEKETSPFSAGVEAGLVKRLMGGESLPEVMAPLIKRVLESGLAGELNFHLAQAAEAGESNRRNGRQSKTVRTEYGAVEVETSRDRLGTFESRKRSHMRSGRNTEGVKD